MGKITTGGVTVKVLTGRRAAPLQRYRDVVEDGVEPPLFMMTRHCSHDAEIQIAEWKATRERHGTQGARRKPRATFEEVDPATGVHASGRPGTHVEYDDGKRPRKRLVRKGETPTHYRVPPQEVLRVKQSEAVHTIYAAGPDLVDPDDHEALERFFLAVCAERDALYPGLQESRWLERNGKSGLVHVHVASNATIYAGFELDGKTYQAGLKMAGELTYKDSVRASFEEYLDEHPEHGYKQGLARVGTPEYREAQLRSGQRDYWDGKHGKISSHEKIRIATFEALQTDGVTDFDAWQQAMSDRGIEVKEVGLRRGKPTKGHDYSYRVAGTTTWTRGRTLGPQYTHEAVSQQLDRRAAGQAIEPRRDKQQAGPRTCAPLTQRPLSVEDHLELEELRRQVEANGRSVRDARDREAAVAAEAARLQALDDARREAADQAVREQQEREALKRQQRLAEAKQRQAQKAAAAQAEHDEAMARLTKLLEGDNADEVGVRAEAVAHDRVPEEEPVEEPDADARDDEAPITTEHGSQLRALRGRHEHAQRKLDLMIQLDETWAPRLEAGEQVDSTFDGLAARADVDREMLDGRIGQRLHPAVRERLEARELAKISGTTTFEWAKKADGDEFRARLGRVSRVRGATKAGCYARAIRLAPTPEELERDLEVEVEVEVEEEIEYGS